MDSAERIYELFEKDIMSTKLTLVSSECKITDISKVVGYCCYSVHPGYLTIKLMEAHKCIEKNCKCFKKFEKLPYWIKKNKLEQEKLKRKKIVQKKKEMQQKEKELLENYKNKAQKIADEYEFNIKITSVIKKYERLFIIFYISSKNYNDWYEYRDVYLKMEYIFGNKFLIKHIKGIDGKYAINSD